jgi:ferredoxin
MRISLDSERCTGHGRCYMLSPEVFDADDDGHGLVREEAVAPELEAAAHRAAANCPEDAISIRE